MGYDWQNYEIGEGDLKLKGPDDAELIDVGACENAELNVDPKIIGLRTGQVNTVIKKIRTEKTVKFKITLLEVGVLRNLVIALGGNPEDIVIGSTPDLFDTYKIKSSSIEIPTEFELEYKVPCMLNKTLYWTFSAKRAQHEGQLSYKFDNENPRMATVEFELLPDSTDDNTNVTIKLDKAA